jgi:tRNA(fMet)-specific endonuclease VapC
MEKYMLDTNSWIEYFKNRNGVADHVDALPRTQLCASEITVAELIYGAYNSNNFEKHYREAMWLKNNIEIYPISDALDDYGDIRFATKRKGNPIGQFDLLIGATARHYGLTVVTDNLKDFSPMPGVKIENWVERPSNE